MTPFLHADWPAPPGVQALTTLRHGAGRSRAPFDTFNLGNRHAADGDDPTAVDANRNELVARLGLPSRPRWLRQVHGTRVLRFARDDGMHATPRPRAFDVARVEGGHRMAPGASRIANGERASSDAVSAASNDPSHGGTASLHDEPEADAAVTSDAGVVLAILTADCLPVLFAARDGTEVAGAHAGWRGLADGVLEATVAAMRTPPSDIVAWLGPAAGPADYEVGIEVYDAFVAQDWVCADAFASTRPHHWRVDLYALARRRLERAGLARGAIHGGGLSTIAEPARFFSHRRDRRTGRMASLVWIAP